LAAVWIQEHGDVPVWHRAMERIEPGWYRMACRWEVRLRDARGFWPQKPEEPGPEVADRCHMCVRVQAERTELDGAP